MSDFLTDAELADVRELLDSYLDTTCTVQIAALTSDDAGGETRTWTNVYSNVACRVEYPVREDSTGIEAARATHLPRICVVISQSVGTLLPGMRVVVAASPLTGVQLDIVEFRGGHLGRELAWYLYCEGPVGE